MFEGIFKGKRKQSKPSRRYHGPSKKHRRSSQRAHAPHENETRFPCKSNHRDCKWKSSGEIECDDGHLRAVAWQKCRKEDARAFIRQYKAPRGGDEIEEAPVAGPAPPQTDQAAQPQQAEQPQGTQEEEAAAGPSSTQAPTAEAAQPVSQQEANTSGGNTVPGPFGQPVPAPGVPPPGKQYSGAAPGTQGMGYSRNVPFAGGYRGGGDTTYAAGYGGGQTGMSSAGRYRGSYDKPFPGVFGQGEMPISGGPAGSGENFRPQSSAVVAPVEARANWVATSPGNLYHSEETDGVVRDQHYTAFKSVWTDTNFSKI